MRFVAGRVHRGGEAGRGAVAKLLLAGAPWRRANREAVAGRGADADGWGLPGRDATIDAGGVAVKEWQWRKGSEGVAAEAGGLAKPERKNFAICARGVSWYLLDFLVNFVNWSDF